MELKKTMMTYYYLYRFFLQKFYVFRKPSKRPSDRQIDIRNYSPYHHIHDDCQRASGGSSIFVQSNIPHSLIDLNTKLQTIAVKVSLTKIIAICFIYITPHTRLDQNDLENLLIQLPIPYLLIGDFNSHSELWGCSDKNDKGKVIEDFIMANDLCLMINKHSTYLHPASGTYTALDLSVCHPSLYLDFDWSVCDGLHGSDHFPLL